MQGYARTALLMAAMTALFMTVGGAVGGQNGAMIALGMAALMNIFALWSSDKMALATYRARPMTDADSPGLVSMTEQMAAHAGIPMPRLYVYDSDQPNAFATGRNPQNAAVAVSTGLLRRLAISEVAGVVAHELAHIKNRDTLIMTITATLAGAISWLANFAMFFGARDSEGRHNPLVGLLVMILAPIAAMVVQMAVSRSREFEADRMGAEICGRPLWLAQALEKIENEVHQKPDHAAQSHPATAHMFIINPLMPGGMTNLFRSHPPTADRVARLHAIERSLPTHD